MAESEDPIAPSQPHENVARMLDSSRNPRRSARPRRTNTQVQRCHHIDSRSESEATVTEEADDTSGSHDKIVPTFDHKVHPALPVDATPENYTIQFEAAQNDNTQDEVKRRKKNILQMNHISRKNIALARLMRGIFGIDASTSCDYCLKKGTVCRLFHPLLYSDAWYLAHRHWQTEKFGRQSCAGCRADHISRQSCNAKYAEYSG
jgi:hypothetical protein